MVYKQIFHFGRLHPSFSRWSHLAHWGETIITKWFSLHIRHAHIEKRVRNCTNMHVQRVYIMDKTSVHGCTWDHGQWLSLIFDQRVL